MFSVVLNCCNRYDGFIVRDTYDEAKTFMDLYLDEKIHKRTATIQQTKKEFGTWPLVKVGTCRVRVDPEPEEEWKI